MPFSDEELSDIIEEIRNDANYFSKTDSILNRCVFHHIDDKKFDDIAVDNRTERELQFSIIGRIVRKTTFLQPEGTFRSGAYSTKREESAALLNARLKVSLAPPRDVLDARTAKEDWALYQSTMTQIINSAIAHKEGAQLWSPYRKDKNIFMFNHLLVSRREQSEVKEGVRGKTMRETSLGKTNFALSSSGEIDNDPIEAGATKFPDQQVNLEHHIDDLMFIKHWPAGEDWHAVADRFERTHYINPLPAFDLEYELILPQAYEAKLLGAVVHARFTLSRFDIREDHVFVCNIVELQVLKPPLGGADIRKKRTLVDLILRKKGMKRRIT